MIDIATPARYSKLSIVVFVVLIAIAWFGFLDHRKLINPDEGRYAEIPYEMVNSGNWITPRLNGLKYLEKPPLQYWVTAATYKVFGFSEWTARLWPALTGFLGILLVWFAGRRLFGADAGIYAALVLLSSPYYVTLGHIITLDMGFTFFLSVAIFTFAHAQNNRNSDAMRVRLMRLVWGALGLAFLSKGLVALVLPTLALVLYSLWQHDWKLWKRLYWKQGVFILAVITLPWIIAVSLANPEFLRFFFIHEHFARFTSTTHHRTGPLWYFFPVLIFAIFVWTPLLPSVFRGLFQTSALKENTFNSQRFLAVWCLVIFVFFSISQSKLLTYILPMLPALALLLGDTLARLEVDQLKTLLIPIAIIMAPIYFASTEAVEAWNRSSPYFQLYEDYSDWLELGAVIIAIFAFISWWFLSRNKKFIGVGVIALGGLVASLLAIDGYESLSPMQSSYSIAQQIKKIDASAPVYSVGMYDQSLTPYLGHPVTLVKFRGELALGIHAEPHKVIHTVEDFVDQWKTKERAFAVMRPSVYRILTQQGVKMSLLYEDTTRVLVQR